MKKISFRFFYFVLLLIPVVHAYSYLRFSSVLEGQLTKQTFAAEMIRSWSIGRTGLGFPFRTFLELSHSGPIPWAEEFPLYSWLASALMWTTGINEVVAGRLISILCLLLLVGLAFQWTARQSARIGLSAPFRYAWIVCCVAGAAIVHYGKSVMPDFPMFVFCFWGLVLAEQKKWMRSRVAFLIAALFKYYAIFPMLGIAIWQMFEERKNTKELLKSAFLWMMFVLPPIAYVILFIKLDIANPITEYRESDGHGHLSSFQFLTQGHFYLRWFTWVLIKLTTLGGGIMALSGLFFARGKKLEWFYFYLATSIGFSILFAPSFFVHDYYALMYLPLLWLGWGYFFKTFESKISGKFATAASVAFCGVFLIWNQVHAHFSNSRQVVLESAMQVQEKCLQDHAVQATDYGVFISTYSQPILPFLSHRTGWMVSLPQLEQPALKDLYLNRLADPRTQYVVQLIQAGVSFQADLGPEYARVCNEDLGQAHLSIYRRK